MIVRGLSTEGLPFFAKVLQCACQGDVKRRVPHTRTFLLDPAHPGPPNHACASPVTLQILSSGSRLFRPLYVGSLQDTNLGLSKFPFFFFFAKYCLRTCLLDVRVLGGLAIYVRVVGVTEPRCFVRKSVDADEPQMPPLRLRSPHRDCRGLLTNLQHNLAVILAFLHQCVGFASLLQRKDFSDHGMELAGCDPF